jgi:hypothetical protein
MQVDTGAVVSGVSRHRARCTCMVAWKILTADAILQKRAYISVCTIESEAEIAFRGLGNPVVCDTAYNLL